MPASPKPKRFFLKALPLYHLTVLAALSLLLVIGVFYLPKDKIFRNEDITLPDSILEDNYIIQVKSGDSFSTIASQVNIPRHETQQILNSGLEAKRLLKLFPGQTIEFFFDKYQRLIRLKYQSSLTETLYVDRNLMGFNAELISRNLDIELNFASGVIDNSLFLAANKAGLNDNTTMELADILGWDIDFALDIRIGDSFSVLYEEKFLDGNKVRNGNILVAEFINQGRTITAIRYEDSSGDIGYFTPEGLSMRKTFRRNPLDIVRVTSRFNLQRKHPVLHSIRAHRGVDYGASTGTPVRATGDGKVITARVKGGYGNTVEIQHGQKYSTLYAHLSKYGKDIREGRYVKQGQIIGYVGSTGLATGPHLHYEFKVNGVHRNPLTIDLPHAKPIAAEEKERFQQYANNILNTFSEQKRAQTAAQL
jgi:murein DD-endopeptidase MepM/ murein hydrolase activator NlpD